jgi:hypothetical protein
MTRGKRIARDWKASGGIESVAAKGAGTKPLLLMIELIGEILFSILEILFANLITFHI